MKKVILLLTFFLIGMSMNATATCYGKWINPITDVCWKCMFPLSIAGAKVTDPNKDQATPDGYKSFFCHCKDTGRVGIPIGFWEPFRVADVTYKPFCMVNLGGMDLKLKVNAPAGTVSLKQGGKTGKKTAFYHVHWYVYPLLVWMNFVTDLACMTPEEFDIAYMTEFDPLWNDDELSMWLNPEAALFANPIAQVACASDCAAASLGKPINSLFWCSGCQGGIYPLTGTLGFYTSGVDASTLLVEKLIFKLHREFLLWGTMGKKGVCGHYPMPWWRKDQYKMQMTYPRIEKNSKLTCNPIGRTTFVWGANKEYPIKGEDFGYLIWRRRDCCVL
jgi:conjugal transfer pilus assembly protein TraU